MNIPQITISEMDRWLTDCEADKEPVWFHGPSGIGKTMVVEAHRRKLARSLGLTFHEVGQPFTMKDPDRTYGFLDLRCALLDSLDVKGAALADKEQDVTRFLPPSLLPNIERHGRYGTLVLDDLPTGFPTTVLAFSSLVSDSRVGDAYRFPPEWTIVAMGNRKEDNSGVNKMPAMMYNRFEHACVLPDVKSFAKFLNANGSDGVLPAFLRVFPEYLHNYTRDDAAFCSPRSLVKADKVYTKIKDDDAYREARLAGCCGVEFATKFSAYVAMKTKLVPWSQIAKDPKGVRIPTQADDQGIGALYALVSLAAHNVTEDTMEAAVDFVERLPEGLQVCFFLDIKAKKPTLVNCTRVSQWRADHNNVAI